jgi:hypothetical protein
MDESVRDGERPEAIRNVAILGHPAAGVTELTCGIQACDETPIPVLIYDYWGWFDD